MRILEEQRSFFFQPCPPKWNKHFCVLLGLKYIVSSYGFPTKKIDFLSEELSFNKPTKSLEDPE